MFVDDALTKQCNICKEVKPATAFYKNKNHRLGLSSNCRECHKAMLVKKRADAEYSYEENVKHHLWVKHRLTPQSYQALFDAQHGLCLDGMHDLRNPVVQKNGDKVYGLRCRGCHFRALNRAKKEAGR